ncbi:P-loop containing nucleoside triphosphate hydrolase protein [Laetiporus sulphureus 93-53]|uniref:Signal recognition particle receptor subunit beta n=1 Tax=Laetiporus sulphureus 93-53 TaxID=1314785 RepID=A0A165G076_9APHY|nr:P-loop containing nucleoside triphosphate hydrolase protein [Laetiporus sulphureus 93-53]KZT09653.1 P-loop containing nucleoside triphosphate hydrolase protein [Laetiporus sulphureus 93-53]
MDTYNTEESLHVESEVLSPASVFTPQTLLIASLSLVVALLAIIIILSRRRSLSKGDALLLVGYSDAGKTAILSNLVYKKTLPTHTSMQVNTSIVPLGERTLRVIDVPGHPRIRDQFREYLPDARAIAFVVDSSTISRNGAAVAEHLHQVLHAITSLPPSRPTPALLIVAHKRDLLKSTAQATPDQLAINRVRTILERELEKRRASQAGGVGVEGLGVEGTESELGGLECSGTGEFRFASWEGGQVDFVGTSVDISKEAGLDENSVDVDGLQPLRRWIEEQL